MVQNKSRRHFRSRNVPRTFYNFRSRDFRIFRGKSPLHLLSLQRRSSRLPRPQITKQNQFTMTNKKRKHPSRFVLPSAQAAPAATKGGFPLEFEMKGSFIDISQSTSTWPSFSQIFQPIYVLSIRPERMREFIRRMGPWGAFCKRGNCVVGSQLDRNQMLKGNVINSAGSKLKLGQIGCWLSHLNAWQCIANAPYEFGTIFEDDVGFSYSAQISLHAQEAMAELEQTSTQWDILYWCISPIPHVAAGLKDCDLKNWYIVPHNHCLGCIAYTIKKSVANLWVAQAKPIHNPVDIWVTSYFNNLKTFCIKPVLGYIVPSYSDTEDQRQPGYLRFLK